MGDQPLDGFVVGITADRRWEEQAALLRRRGAAIVHGPVLRTLPLAGDSGLREATEALVAEPPHVVVANTGIGIRSWLSAAESWGIGDALLAVLRDARIVARGPKAAGALVTAGCRVDWRSSTGRLTDVIDHLTATPLDGCRVAFQLDGSGSVEVTRPLERAGASVVPLAVYRWTAPADPRPAERLVDAVCRGAVDAVTFTSAPAVHSLFAIGHGNAASMRSAFADHVRPICIGPVCMDAALAHGLRTATVPARPVLGAMVNDMTEALVAERRVLDVEAGELCLVGSAVLVNGERVALSGRERAVLRALARRPGRVVPKTVLLREVWGDEGADAHALEVTIGRLRRRLGPAGTTVRTIVRRGYQLS